MQDLLRSAVYYDRSTPRGVDCPLPVSDAHLSMAPETRLSIQSAQTAGQIDDEVKGLILNRGVFNYTDSIGENRRLSSRTQSALSSKHFCPIR